MLPSKIHPLNFWYAFGAILAWFALPAFLCLFSTFVWFLLDLCFFCAWLWLAFGLLLTCFGLAFGWLAVLAFWLRFFCLLRALWLLFACLFDGCWLDFGWFVCLFLACFWLACFSCFLLACFCIFVHCLCVCLCLLFACLFDGRWLAFGLFVCLLLDCFLLCFWLACFACFLCLRCVCLCLLFACLFAWFGFDFGLFVCMRLACLCLFVACCVLVCLMDFGLLFPFFHHCNTCKMFALNVWMWDCVHEWVLCECVNAWTHRKVDKPRPHASTSARWGSFAKAIWTYLSRGRFLSYCKQYFLNGVSQYWKIYATCCVIAAAAYNKLANKCRTKYVDVLVEGKHKGTSCDCANCLPAERPLNARGQGSRQTSKAQEYNSTRNVKIWWIWCRRVFNNRIAKQTTIVTWMQGRPDSQMGNVVVFFTFCCVGYFWAVWQGN